jgi:cation diffusion facilitator family transporter
MKTMKAPNSETARLSLMASASIFVAVLVMAIKYLAYLQTGSVALYSDAAESVVNLVTAVAALIAIRVSLRPADKRHPFGHHKAELFAAVLEGVLITVAALVIIQEAWHALHDARVVQRPYLGLLINGLATAINAGWAYLLITRGKAWRSPALVADGWHLLTDVFTSVGVLAGVMLVAVTGWQILDPLLAIAVAVNILFAGYRITMQSMSTLMDEAASAEIQARIHEIIAANGNGALQAHDIRTRHAGRAMFIDFHLVVPGEMTVAAAHEICDRLESAVEAEIEGAEVVIHVEPEHKAKARAAVQL